MLLLERCPQQYSKASWWSTCVMGDVETDLSTARTLKVCEEHHLELLLETVETAIATVH